MTEKTFRQRLSRVKTAADFKKLYCDFMDFKNAALKRYGLREFNKMIERKAENENL